MAPIDPDTIWLKPWQVAERSGVAVSALRYYEQLGLISSRRTSGNRREYRRDVLRVIAFIRTAQRLGVDLDRIKEALAELPDHGVPQKHDWARISRQWRDDLTKRIDELTALRDNFSNCIGCGCLSLTACPYSNPDDILGNKGAGAQRLFGTP